MTATLLTGSDQKEGLSVVYVKALAARAGFSTAGPKPDREQRRSADHGARAPSSNPRPAPEGHGRSRRSTGRISAVSIESQELQQSLRRDADATVARVETVAVTDRGNVFHKRAIAAVVLPVVRSHWGVNELSRNRRRAQQRRTSVLASLEAKREGGSTTHAARLGAEHVGGIATVCTVTHYCRTTVFEYPGCHMSTEASVPQLIIANDDAFRAAVVSDLPAYFQQDVFPHYAVDVSLREGIDRVYRKVLSQSKSPNPTIFLVTEEYKAIPATQFAKGECFLIDEWRDGKALIEGGREGKRALLAFKTTDGAWPDFSRDSHAVNTVLAAVKVEQNVTHHLDELYSCSCFVSEDERAVYTVELTMNVSYGGARVSSPVDADGLRGRVAGVRSIYDGLRQDSLKTPQVAELIDAVLLEKTGDDAHFRLWYLRLWQAVVDAKRILGQPKLEDDAKPIAGNLTAAQLKDYRDRIAHWWTGNVDFSFVTGIQQTAQELMRRKYRKGMSE